MGREENRLRRRTSRRLSKLKDSTKAECRLAAQQAAAYWNQPPALLETQSNSESTPESDEPPSTTERRLFWKKTEEPWTPALREIHQEAWMCGVCGKAFLSLEAAEHHEDIHVRQVVVDLGWDQPDNSDFLLSPIANNTTTVTSVTTPLNKNETNKPVKRRNKKKRSKPQQKVRFHEDDSSPPVSISEFVDDDDDDDRNDPAYRELPEHSMPTLDELPEDALMPSASPRRRNQNHTTTPSSLLHTPSEHDILMSTALREYVVLADQALVSVCQRAEPLILTRQELSAERELEYLASDKAYYDHVADRLVARRVNPTNRFRTEGRTVLSKVQNKFLDAYQLCKEGGNPTTGSDQYNRKIKGNENDVVTMDHTHRTLYVNVMVKNSISVVRHELERRARQRWEDSQTKEMDKINKFERFRALAHGNLVKLAGIALASDFTPRRIAVQLSNDLYRLLTPRLKRRGVTIETEIEYRVGPYFVLAVNFKTIDWERLIKYTHKDMAERRLRWREQKRQRERRLRGPEVAEEKSEGETNKALCFYHVCLDAGSSMRQLSKDEILAQVLASLYYVHWIIYVPLCFIAYHTVLGSLLRKVILSTVADEIFFYVEEKGMEMEIGVREASIQAAFMLSALREIRADDRQLKRKREETQSADKGLILGPLLGPSIKADKAPYQPPPGVDVPENLEFIGLELDLPVGFRRLRWALLNSESAFVPDAIFKSEAKYDNITMGKWSKHDEHIGLAVLPAGVNEEDFIGAEKETSYLMPKSAFVKANMATETNYLTHYNDTVFCLKKKALTPDVPYGNSFIAWTQYVVVNTGAETCHLTCSVEAEFPNGPPMVSRQIKSGMRAGVAELFVKVGETITRYADEYP